MQIKTALILCAGFGKRLNPLTLDTPKPLLKINDKVLLEYSIKLVKNLKINKIKINTFYLKNKIDEFFKNHKVDLDIEVISDGKEILDTGGGILNMIKNSKEEHFLVLNPDTIWNKNYVDSINEMEKIYFKNSLQNILLVVNKRLSFDKSLKGDFNLSENFLNKQEPREFIYTGCQILNKNMFTNINKNKFSINPLWDDLIYKNKLFGLESKDRFFHITDLKIYKDLLKN